ncbi:Vacuolar protease A [Irineochytrium annulatum]|nr:Vacuolar protease A [Irineochytrium annulatum]
MLDIDTGSSDTWVRGSGCAAADAADTSCVGDKLVETDTTIKATGLSWDTKYGSGEVAGDIYVSDVTIPSSDPAVPAAKAVGMLIGVSKRERTISGTDGLLGLAFATISEIQHSVKGSPYDGTPTNFFDALGLPRGQRRFGIYLTEDQEGDGEITFGGHDEGRIKGEAAWYPLTSQTYWQFDVRGARYEIETKGVKPGAALVTGPLVMGIQNAIADTGSTLLMLETSVAAAVNAALGVRADGSVDCAKIPKLPDFSMVIGNYQFYIPAHLWVWQKGGNVCATGIVGGASGVIILGDIFLRRFYSVYDKDGSQIGFYEAVHLDPTATATVTATEVAPEPTLPPGGLVGSGKVAVRKQRVRW